MHTKTTILRCKYKGHLDIFCVLTHRDTTKNITTWNKTPKDAHHLKSTPLNSIKNHKGALEQPHTVNAGVSAWVWVGQNVYILLQINEFIKSQPLLFLCWIFLANLHLPISIYTYVVPNNYQRDATFLNSFISTDALHVPGGSSAHHHEHTTVHTASGIVNQYWCLLLSWMRWNASSKQQYWLTIPEAVCIVFVLLMMGGGTAWNM